MTSEILMMNETCVVLAADSAATMESERSTKVFSTDKVFRLSDAQPIGVMTYGNAAVSGANQDLFLNALGWMCQQEETISIRAKSLGSSYLTVSSSDASRWSFILIALVPLCFIVPGAYTAIKRRRQ